MAAVPYLFWTWFSIGLVLLLIYRVPSFLQFSNALFLLFFAVYSLYLERGQASGLHGEGWLQSRLGGFRFQDLLRALMVGVITYLIEWNGTITGWPFGSYVYTNTLRLWDGGIPIAIPWAWIGVMTTSVMLSTSSNRFIRGVQAGMYALVFDLVLDPVAYHLRFWEWSSEGAWGTYYGVPWQNFTSWFTIAFLLSFLYPVRPMQTPVPKASLRLYQGMLAMFGLLALKAGLWGPFAIALLTALVLEGGIRHDRSKQEQLV